jgi:hypothetical protein
MERNDLPQKKDNSEYFTRVILWTLLGVGAILGFILLIFRATGTLR